MNPVVALGAIVICLAAWAPAFVLAQDEAVVEKKKEVPPVLLQMMRNDSIHEHLLLDSPAREAIHATLNEIDGPWWRSRLLEDKERHAEVAKLTETLRSTLKKHLTASQIKRVGQLELQAALTEDDKPRIEKMTRKEVLATFGEPFDFASVKRTLPRAPELLDGRGSEPASQGNWIGGQPQTLESLRGKVVAVHFYAFQCINCVRNLPHYKSWHEDLADKGLVVIGIQTPETSRERDVAAVQTAAEQAGIAYSVLMDPSADNWKAWGNTMWPTVYLVDKEGYIRTWWQGELNWEGATGEQTMREHITKLLAE